jgi:F-type H+-transporting ATPase subunit gamma
MELVSASKMKRAVSSTLASRLYAEYSSQILASISENIKNKQAYQLHPFFNEQENGKILVILLTSNRGLCGGYNSQVIKKTIEKLRELDSQKIDFVTVGKKGDIAMRRIDQNITGVFTEMPDTNVRLSDMAPLSRLVMDEYKNLKYKRIYIVYTQFVSALVQRPVVKLLLPIAKEEFLPSISQEVRSEPDYLFEGDVETLISSLAEKITRMQIYQMFLESNASEQSARMIAMKNASDASSEMIDDLTLMFNKARQANITREISEISAGMVSAG